MWLTLLIVWAVVIPAVVVTALYFASMILIRRAGRADASEVAGMVRDLESMLESVDSPAPASATALVPEPAGVGY